MPQKTRENLYFSKFCTYWYSHKKTKKKKKKKYCSPRILAIQRWQIFQSLKYQGKLLQVAVQLFLSKCLWYLVFICFIIVALLYKLQIFSILWQFDWYLRAKIWQKLVKIVFFLSIFDIQYGSQVKIWFPQISVFCKSLRGYLARKISGSDLYYLQSYRLLKNGGKLKIHSKPK